MILLTAVACALLQGGGARAQDPEETRIREGRRVHRGDLPHTASTMPVWLAPLVVATGLACTSAGIAIILRANEKRDAARLDRSGVALREADDASSARPPVPPPPPLPSTGRDPTARAPGAERVAAAWGAIGRASRAPRARAGAEGGSSPRVR